MQGVNVQVQNQILVKQRGEHPHKSENVRDKWALCGV